MRWRPACRERYGGNWYPAMAGAQAGKPFEWTGFTLNEFPVPEFNGRNLKRSNISGQLVGDGYWVHMHLSKVLYTRSDWQVFLDFIDAIVIQPKSQ